MPEIEPEVEPWGNSRWHTEQCQLPDIVVSATGIHCGACNRTPNMPEMLARQREEEGFRTFPPDEPYGAMDLFWPSTVPYAGGTRMRSADYGGLFGVDFGEMDEDWDPIYPEALQANEIRLLRLDAAEDPDTPIHLSLEAHNERYPEYEATSYTWGGEDGDNARCWPVYVGPYWDVLLQTKNCRDMLTFLRPNDGVTFNRVLWVDAICINQNDNNERASQVAQMRQIYKRCRRVVVYLGPDVATSPSQAYPLRRSFEEVATLRPSSDLKQFFDSDNSSLLGSLLQRRYFGRVWVIQELLLARQVVIQVGDLEVLIDASSRPSLLQRQKDEPGYSWEDTAAPWMQFAAQGRFMDLSIAELLELTNRSTCSDPRDKVFGLLGLIQEDDRVPIPDYSLSLGHVLAGIAAHCVLSDRSPELFCNAAGYEAHCQSPSWIPAWDQFLPLHDAAQVPARKWSSGPSAAEVQEINTRFCQLFSSPYSRLFDVNTEMKQGNPEHVILCQEQGGGDTPMVRDRIPWHKNAVVHPSTAALTLNLTHLGTIPAYLEVHHKLDGMTSYRITTGNGNEALQPAKLRDGSVAMYILSRRPELEKVLKPLDHIFILDRPDKPPLFLILRPCNTPDGSFSLITSCHHVLFELSRAAMHFAIRWTGKTQSVFLFDIQRSFDQAMSDMDSHYKATGATGSNVVRCPFPGIEGCRHAEWLALLHGRLYSRVYPEAYCGMASNDFRLRLQMIDAYISHVHPRFEPQKHVHPDQSKAVLSLRVAPSNREGIFKPGGLLFMFPHRAYASEVSGRSAWPWDTDKTNPPSRVDTCELDQDRRDEDIYIYAFDSDLHAAFWTMLTNSMFFDISHTVAEIGGDGGSLPRRECLFWAYPRLPWQLVDAFGTTGSLFRVTIS
ncbi:heterokaryon incompatibility protein-domain-containing protein [Lasiosphaeria hispida]|uniref:Heterokaryon incompatibility protein-domain-containing protein n=1 Tax=Lasiosphaeria hispida TaxID=260671 RepID=A0AAJ0HD05_9PEZI|nr:heterokaryon incompatibility protein-domain-containing protein [Lasiosphaeria hispida]